MNEQRRSRFFAAAQTLLLAAFAAVVLFVRGALFFTAAAATAVGLAICALGVVLMALAFIALRGVVQIAPEPKRGGHLVTDGVYARLRHPIYTAMLLIVIGLFLRKPTAALAICSSVVIAFLFAKTKFEEQMLASRYPDYSEYRRRTWGLIPGLR